MSCEIRTCRFCKIQDEAYKMYKYGTRQYAHWECYFMAYLKRAADFLPFVKSLPTHQVARLPIFVLAEQYKDKFHHKEQESRRREIIDQVEAVYKGKRAKEEVVS